MRCRVTYVQSRKGIYIFCFNDTRTLKSISSPGPALAFPLQDATSTKDLKAHFRVSKTFQATP